MCSILTDTGIAGMQYGDHPAAHELLQNAATPPNTDLWQAMNLRDYFEHLFTTSQTVNGVGGFKVMWQQLDDLAGAITAYTHHREVTIAGLHQFLPSNTRYIWLTRADSLRQAVSWVKATDSNAWDSRRQAAYTGTYRFDARRIRRFRNMIAAGNRGWQYYFDSNRITPYRLTYEALVADVDASVAAVLRYLNIPVPSAVKAGSYFCRQSDDVNEDWVMRYRRQQKEGR